MSLESNVNNTAHPKDNPFVCHFMPFICQTKPVKSPFIAKKNPFVGIVGFTMIELVITMTIAGIIMALAMPAMTDLIKNHRLSGQANDLLADFAFARSEAVRRGATVTVCKQDPTSTTPKCDTTNTAPWTPGWVVFIDSILPSPNANNQIDAGEMVLRTHAALDARNFVTAANTAATGFDNAAVLIRFTNKGATRINPAAPQPAGSTTVPEVLGVARFRFCDNRGTKNALTVELSAMGRARVNSSQPPDPNTCPTNSNW